MSTQPLPVSVDAMKYADQGRVLEGYVAVAQMQNVAGLLAEASGKVQVTLQFSRDEQNLRVIVGELASELVFECQRCLEPVSKSVSSRFTLGLAYSDEQAKHLPKAYEPLLVTAEGVNIHALVEEELILSMPMFAYHDACTPLHATEDEQATHTQSESKGPANPFGVLADLKLKK